MELYKVFKYVLQFSTGIVQPIIMPPGAEVLTVQLQELKVCMWAKVRADIAHSQERKFILIGTGRPLPDSVSYVGTFQDGDFVGHVFEVL